MNDQPAKATHTHLTIEGEIDCHVADCDVYRIQQAAREVTGQPAMTAYRTEDAALRRVEQLKTRGYWPGVIRRSDGLFSLTFDPDDKEASIIPASHQERARQNTQARTANLIQ